MYRQGDMYSSFIAIDPKVQGVASPGSRSITIPSFKKWNVTNQEESFQPIPPQKVFYRSPCKNIYTICYIIYPSTLFFIEIHKLRVKTNCPQKKIKVVKTSITNAGITTLTTLALTTLAPTTGGLEASHFSLCKMDLFFALPGCIPAESSLAADLEDSITSATSTRLNLSKTSGPVEVGFVSLRLKDILGGKIPTSKLKGASYESRLQDIN